MLVFAVPDTPLNGIIIIENTRVAPAITFSVGMLSFINIRSLVYKPKTCDGKITIINTSIIAVNKLIKVIFLMIDITVRVSSLPIALLTNELVVEQYPHTGIISTI